MEDKEAKSIIEAILFISGEPVSLDTIRKLIEVDKYNTDRLIRELISDYSVRHTGILIIEVSEGFQMVTNPACAPWVRKLLNTSVPKKLSQSSLETVAIVAYKQPIIKAEIEAIRGVNSDGVVKTLLERRMIKILGRKEVPGRPLMYGTTKEFLQYFGLKDLSELPTLKEFSEVDMPEPPETLPDESDMPEGMPQGHSEANELGEQPQGSLHESTEPEDAKTALDDQEEMPEEMEPAQANAEGKTFEESLHETSAEEHEPESGDEHDNDEEPHTGEPEDDHVPAEKKLN